MPRCISYGRCAIVNQPQGLVLGFFLQLAGVLSAGASGWYVVVQGLIGVAQLAIGLAMLAGYRRSGVWGVL